MAKTISDRVEALVESSRELTRQTDQTDAVVTRLNERLVLTKQRLLESERRIEQLRIEAAVLRRDADELRKAGDVWGARIWTVVVAVLAGGLGYYLKR